MCTVRRLSRLTITGPIHENVPSCVLEEIADAHGIRHDMHHTSNPKFIANLIAMINTTEISSISDECTAKDLQLMARFVNCNETRWTKNKLLAAYNYLALFSNNNDPLPHIPPDFSYGIQTSEHPLNVNACALYKTCVFYHINVHHHTSIDAMANAIRMLRETPDSLLRKAQFMIERKCNITDLVNVLMVSPIPIHDPNPEVSALQCDYNTTPEYAISHSTLGLLYESLNNVVVLRNNTDPSTPRGAIGLAALNYYIDISRSSNPIVEYNIIKRTGRDRYTPFDSWMKYWYAKNSSMFDLTVTFVPNFPREYYPNLDELVNEEGFTTLEIATQDPYELMQLAHISNTFHTGPLPNMLSHETLVDHVDDIPYGELLCYGNAETGFKPISIGDLETLFKTNMNFTNPFDITSTFSATAINKLKRHIVSLRRPHRTPNLSQETILLMNRLHDAITQVEAFTQLTDEASKALALRYRDASADIKEMIRGTLNNLLRMGMYMRGWNGSGPYPIENTIVTPERIAEVDMNVSSAIETYERSNADLMRIGHNISALPLVRYRNEVYQASTDRSQGLTVGDRIDIVKSGESTQNIASCIRMSSNWLCASAHKYISAVGLPPPFDIRNLRTIS